MKGGRENFSCRLWRITSDAVVYDSWSLSSVCNASSMMRRGLFCFFEFKSSPLYAYYSILLIKKQEFSFVTEVDIMGIEIGRFYDYGEF